MCDGCDVISQREAGFRNRLKRDGSGFVLIDFREEISSSLDIGMGDILNFDGFSLDKFEQGAAGIRIPGQRFGTTATTDLPELLIISIISA